MAAMKPRTGDGPLEATKEGRGIVMRVPLEGGGRLVVELTPDEAAALGDELKSVTSYAIGSAVGLRAPHNLAVDLQRLLGDVRPGELVDAALASGAPVRGGPLRVGDQRVDRVGQAGLEADGSSAS